MNRQLINLLYFFSFEENPEKCRPRYFRFVSLNLGTLFCSVFSDLHKPHYNNRLSRFFRKKNTMFTTFVGYQCDTWDLLKMRFFSGFIDLRVHRVYKIQLLYDRIIQENNFASPTSNEAENLGRGYSQRATIPTVSSCPNVNHFFLLKRVN